MSMAMTSRVYDYVRGQSRNTRKARIRSEYNLAIYFLVVENIIKNYQNTQKKKLKHFCSPNFSQPQKIYFFQKQNLPFFIQKWSYQQPRKLLKAKNLFNGFRFRRKTGKKKHRKKLAKWQNHKLTNRSALRPAIAKAHNY